jgi:hypothetical protein
LLYEDGFTIEGARSQLISTSVVTSQPVKFDELAKKMIAELEMILQNLQSDVVLDRQGM